MGTLNEWRGDAVAVKQLDTVTVTGPASSTGTAWAEINNKRVTVNVVNTQTAASIANALYDACANADIPEFLTLDFAYVALALTFTAASKTAGIPFVMTVGKTGTGLTVTSATTTAATGPNDGANPLNWTLGSKPGATGANLENIVVKTGPAILYNLDTMFDDDCIDFRHFATHTAGIGLPKMNTTNGGDGYREYLQTHMDTLGTAKIYVGEGEGDGPAIMNLVSSSDGIEYVVRRAGGNLGDGTPCVDICTLGFDDLVYAFGGTVGVGVRKDCVNLASAFHVANDATLTAYTGTDNLYVRGGNLVMRGQVNAAVVSGGTWLHEDGTIGTIQATAGVVRLTHQQGGSITCQFQGAQASDPPVLDLSANTLASRTISNTSYFRGGAQLLDPFFTASLSTVEFDLASFQASDIGDRFKITRALAP